MQRSASIRAELEDAVAGMSPAARAVYEDTKRRNEAGEPNPTSAVSGHTRAF
jgi:hypothetical protein